MLQNYIFTIFVVKNTYTEFKNDQNINMFTVLYFFSVIKK